MLTYSHPPVTLALCSERQWAVADREWKIDTNRVKTQEYRYWVWTAWFQILDPFF